MFFLCCCCGYIVQSGRDHTDLVSIRQIPIRMRWLREDVVDLGRLSYTSAEQRQAHRRLSVGQARLRHTHPELGAVLVEFDTAARMDRQERGSPPQLFLSLFYQSNLFLIELVQYLLTIVVHLQIFLAFY